MGFDKVKLKQIYKLIVFVAVIVLLLIYSEILFGGLKLLVGIFLPFLIGGAIAFILNIPMNSLEKKLLKKWNGKVAGKLKRPLCMVLSIIFVFAILALVVVAVVPQLRTTISTLGAKITPFLQDVLVWLKNLTTDYPELTAQIQELENIEFNWESIISNVGNFLKNGVGSMVGSTVTVATSIIGGVANVFIAFVFAIYILSQKEKLQNQAIRILDAYVPVKQNRTIKEVFHRLYVNFSNFICGQCLEAVILGILFVVFMTIFRMPYAIMIGTLIAFTSLIPIVGAFIGCGVGAFMILIDNPIQALWFVVMFLIIQQLEGNLIYPKVVGNSVGLPSIWVLMSVSVGGSLFGVVGMLMFIPLMSTLYSLLRDDVNRRNGGRAGIVERGNSTTVHQAKQRKNKEKKDRLTEKRKAEAGFGTAERVMHGKADSKQENVQANRTAEPQTKEQQEKMQQKAQAKVQHENKQIGQEHEKREKQPVPSKTKGANTDALAQIIAEVSASVQETSPADASEKKTGNNHHRRKRRRPKNTEHRKQESNNS